MKKVFVLLAIVIAGTLTSCGNGADTKPAADSTAAPKDTTKMSAAPDTTKADTGKPKTIVPPNN